MFESLEGDESRGLDGKERKKRRVNENEGEWLPIHFV